MNKILSAFNDITDSYITDALEYKKARVYTVNLKWIAAVACAFLVIFAGVGVMHKIWNNNGVGVQTPQYIYQVGDKITLGNGTCEYVECTDSTISLIIQSDKNIDYTFSIDAYRWIGENERITYVATTGRYDAYGDKKVLKDVLTIYVDGIKTSSIDIPEDGKEHEVIIDFSYLTENNYDIETSWELTGVGRFGLSTPKK